VYPRGRAWLRTDTVRQTEVAYNLRGMQTLPHHAYWGSNLIAAQVCGAAKLTDRNAVMMGQSPW
jgi:hypothetical protein